MEKRRQTNRALALFLSSIAVSVPSGGVAFLSSMKPQLRPLHGTKTPNLPPFFERIEQESNFWRTIVTKQNNKKDDNQRIPCDPSLLDADGPLPAGAYQILGNTQQEPKPTCRLSISMDTRVLFQSDENEAVSKLHQFMDCGFNTFQLDDELVGVYRKLRADTPETVLNACQFVNTFQTPCNSVMAQPSIVQDEILHILRRNGGDCMDTLELKYTSGSDYHLDVLDVLTDLQREGFVRSILTKDFSPDLLRQAASCGFAIDANKISCNLFNPIPYTKELQLACFDLKLPLRVSSPLAGGMLTGKYAGIQREPPPWELLPVERNYVNNTITRWAKKIKDDNRWNIYQEYMMDTLIDIAHKHGVSVTLVSLRWAMQLDHVASVIVPCDYEPEKLRKVFCFELDDDDMDRLWKATGEEGLVVESNFMDRDSDLPDLSNTKLWL